MTMFDSLVGISMLLPFIIGLIITVAIIIGTIAFIAWLKLFIFRIMCNTAAESFTNAVKDIIDYQADIQAESTRCANAKIAQE